MKKLKTEIQKMLTSSVLISAKQKQEISRNLENYSQDQLTVLHSFLSEASINQKTLLWQATKKDPKFIDKIQKSLIAGERVMDTDLLFKDISRVSQEKEIQNQENQEISDIEQELQNI